MQCKDSGETDVPTDTVLALGALANDLLTILNELAPEQTLPFALHGMAAPHWMGQEGQGGGGDVSVQGCPAGPRSQALQAAQRLRTSAHAVSTVCASHTYVKQSLSISLHRLLSD